MPPPPPLVCFCFCFCCISFWSRVLVGLWVVYMIAAAYCEMVVPSSVGIKEHPLFFLDGAWWKKKCARRDRRTAAGANPLAAYRAEAQRGGAPTQSMPADVKAEREVVWGGNRADIVRMLDLRVVYESTTPGVPDNVAVDCVSLGVTAGQCFGLLGPNGSGKTSAINCLCGYQMPTLGTALVAGLDIRHDVDLVHLSLGVCPQDNVLWEEMTGAEHLRFYGQLKDLHGRELEEEVALRLEQVELTDAADKLAGAYSGGMQRRLCVAIALMGSPAVVVLDEPSTGLDPAARRTLWRVIRTCSKNSAVLLTTHSMEEADQLCDRVGILVNGTMFTVGSPTRMKSDVGDFLKLTVMVEDPAKFGPVEEFIHSLVPDASLLIEPLGSTWHYRLPRSSEGARLSTLIRALESNWERLGVSDWAVTNVTLEEVFLKVTESVTRVGQTKGVPSVRASLSHVSVDGMTEEAAAAAAAAEAAGASANAGAGAASGAVTTAAKGGGVEAPETTSSVAQP